MCRTFGLRAYLQTTLGPGWTTQPRESAHHQFLPHLHPTGRLSRRMGTCSRGGSRGLVSNTTKGSHITGRLRLQLANSEPARILVNTALAWVVATNPAVSTVYTTYKIATGAYQIARSYERSIRAGNRQVERDVKQEIRDAAIDRATASLVPPGLPAPASNLLKALVSSVLSEVIPG
jgi:hypothetical protein